MKEFIAIPIFFIIFIASCAQTKEIETQTKTGTEVDNMKLTSTAFKNNGAIPLEHTCDGQDVSPELEISDVPKNTKSLALIMDDPDAPMGTFVHWVVWNIPPDTSKIAKDTEPSGVQGRTDFGRKGYGGPCPPSGTHRYFFKLYALDTELNLPAGSTKKDLEKAMQGHIIAKTELIGAYKRQR